MLHDETILRKLQKIVSGKAGRLFENQVCFYNGIFGMTNPELFPDNLIDSMMEASENRSVREIETFLRSGLDASSSNVGKHINDIPGMGVPKYHCIHFALPEYKVEICRRMSVLLHYCSEKNNADLCLLFQNLKEELSDFSAILRKADFADEKLLGVILYEIVQSHLGERHCPDTSRQERAFGKVNMKQQIEEYYLTCDCYEATSMDYFLALQRMADKNVIASSNLAGFYYVGTEFLVKNEGGGPHGRYVVERNLEQAARCFCRAASSQPPYAPAAYSYGYMILHGETGDLTQEERMTEAQRYYELSAKYQFHHAVSGLGELALMRANQFLQAESADVSDESIICQLASAIGYFTRAQEMGSFWGPIRAAQFLDNPLYEPYRTRALKQAGLPEGDNARDRWNAAVAMGNAYAMEQLALLNLRMGERREAKILLERAAQINYPEASWHLAEHFYSEKGTEPDAERYRRTLEKASHDGSARASLKLAVLAFQAGDNEAGSWLQKAEEQNLQCFDKRLYEEIQVYKRRK